MRGVYIRFNFSAKFYTIHIRHDNIADNQVGNRIQCAFKSLYTIRSCIYFVFFTQFHSKKVTNLYLIIYNKDLIFLNTLILFICIFPYYLCIFLQCLLNKCNIRLIFLISIIYLLFGITCFIKRNDNCKPRTNIQFTLN